MPQTPSAPEQQAPPKPLHELKQTKPQPEMKQKRPEPEIKETPQTEKDLLEKEDQADSGPDKDNPITQQDARDAASQPDPADAHIGAREDQVSDTQAPSGDAFKDEPRQG
jgi:hypothetical protein